MWSYNYNWDELYHHGVLKQKHGVRRYQNYDGSLTPLGREHRRQLAAANKGTTKTKKQSKTTKEENAEQKTKSVKDMTDDELSTATKRLKAETDYYKARKDHAEATPKKVSTGQKFVSTVANKVIAPAATGAGKQLLQEWMETEGRKALGLPAKSSGNNKKKKKKG